MAIIFKNFELTVESISVDKTKNRNFKGNI